MQSFQIQLNGKIYPNDNGTYLILSKPGIGNNTAAAYKARNHNKITEYDFAVSMILLVFLLYGYSDKCFAVFLMNFKIILICKFANNHFNSYLCTSSQVFFFYPKSTMYFWGLRSCERRPNVNFCMRSASSGMFAYRYVHLVVCSPSGMFA